MPDLTQDEQNFLATMKAHGGSTAPLLSPDESKFLETLHKSVPDREIAATSQGAVMPDWDARREAIDTFSDGRLTDSSEKAANAQQEWRKQNPTLAFEIRHLTGPSLVFLASTGIGRGILAASELAGAPSLGELLTGTFGRDIPGALGFAARAASRGLGGAWQGALSQLLYPGRQGYSGSIAEGAGANILTGALTSPFRNSISPEVAQLAQRAREEGLPIRTGMLPGASFASRTAGKWLGMSRPDLHMLTSRAMASIGSDSDIVTPSAIEAAQNRIGQNLDNIALNSSPITYNNSRINNRLWQIEQEANSAHGLASEPEELRKINFHLDNLHNLLAGGGIDGPTLQAITKSQSALSRLGAGNTAGNLYARQIKDALYDSLSEADPSQSEALALARNQWRNSVILDNLKDKGVDANGILDPKKYFNNVISNYGGTSEADQASALSGNPVGVGTIAATGRRLTQQPVTNLSYPSMFALGGVGGAALGGEEAMEGLPLVHSIVNHPVMSLGLGAYGAGILGIGAAQNSELYTNMLLARAASGRPLFGGANMLVPMAHEAYRGGPSNDASAAAAYIQQAAQARGIDPSVALRVARSEGLGGGYIGDEGSSFGPFQLHYGNMPGVSKGNQVSGLGDLFTATTGLHASDPSTTRAQIDFALDYAKQHGWSYWHGWKGDEFAGIPSSTPETPVESSVNVTPTSMWTPPQSNGLTGGQ